MTARHVIKIVCLSGTQNYPPPPEISSRSANLQSWRQNTEMVSMSDAITLSPGVSTLA